MIGVIMCCVPYVDFWIISRRKLSLKSVFERHKTLVRGMIRDISDGSGSRRLDCDRDNSYIGKSMRP